MLKDDGNFSTKAKESILWMGVHILKGPENLEEKTHTTRLVNCSILYRRKIREITLHL